MPAVCNALSSKKSIELFNKWLRELGYNYKVILASVRTPPSGQGANSYYTYKFQKYDPTKDFLGLFELLETNGTEVKYEQYNIKKPVEHFPLFYQSNVWNKIRDCLQNKQEIRYWSRTGRTKQYSFTIKEVGLNYIIVLAESTGSPQLIPKEDFLKVYEVWEGYLRGRVKRYQLRDMTRFSSYIISILHECEDYIKQ